MEVQIVLNSVLSDQAGNKWQTPHPHAFSKKDSIQPISCSVSRASFDALAHLVESSGAASSVRSH